MSHYRFFAGAAFLLLVFIQGLLIWYVPISFVASYFISISLVTLILCGFDKASAISESSRVPEKIFWGLCAIGGALGMIVGMYFFRHKTRKAQFKFMVGLILILQLLLVGWVSGCETKQALSQELDEVYRIGFGSCVKNPNTPIWEIIKSKHPDVFVFLGDNVYLESHEWKDEDRITEKYKAVYSTPQLTEFLTRISILAIWDDHDFGSDNSDSTFYNGGASLRAFRNHWKINSTVQPLINSVASSTLIKDIELILADNRSYRINPGKPNSQHWGDKQLAWIERQLLNPRGKMIVLANGGQLLTAASEGTKVETLGQYPLEQRRFIQAISTSPVPVVLISGDRHYAEILKLKGATKEVIEITSSPLSANLRTKPLKPDPRRISSYQGSSNFGLLTIDLKATPVQILAQVFNDQGEEVLRYSINA